MKGATSPGIVAGLLLLAVLWGCERAPPEKVELLAAALREAVAAVELESVTVHPRLLMRSPRGDPMYAGTASVFTVEDSTDLAEAVARIPELEFCVLVPTGNCPLGASPESGFLAVTPVVFRDTGRAEVWVTAVKTGGTLHHAWFYLASLENVANGWSLSSFRLMGSEN